MNIVELRKCISQKPEHWIRARKVEEKEKPARIKRDENLQKKFLDRLKQAEIKK